MGGQPPLGYDVKDRKLIINEAEAKTVRPLSHFWVVHCEVTYVPIRAFCTQITVPESCIIWGLIWRLNATVFYFIKLKQ